MGIHGIGDETGGSRSRPRRPNGLRAVGRPSRSPCSRPGVVCTSQRFAVRKSIPSIPSIPSKKRPAERSERPPRDVARVRNTSNRPTPTDPRRERHASLRRPPRVQRFAVAWCDGPHALNGSDGHSWDRGRNGRFPFSPATPERFASRWPPVALAMLTPRRRLHVAALRGSEVHSVHPVHPVHHGPSRPRNAPPSAASTNRVTWPVLEAPASTSRSRTWLRHFGIPSDLRSRPHLDR